MRALTIGLFLAVILGGCARSHTLRLGRESEVFEASSLPAGIAERVVLDMLGPPQRLEIREDGSRVLTYFQFDLATMRSDSYFEIDPVYARSGSFTFVDGELEPEIGYFHIHYDRVGMDQRQQYFKYLRDIGRVKASGEPARNGEGEILVDIDANRYPITGVIDVLSQYTGLYIKPEPADLEGEVTLTSVSEPWRNVLETAARQVGCTVRRESSGPYIVQKVGSVLTETKAKADNPSGD